jgi:phenol 2-monooxygenase
VYQIGQRIATQLTKGDRVFLAGDAVHTHSPKMGLGMNMSLQDGFNLGWKVALAVAGATKPEILKTYDLERHPLAEMLIEFDRNWVTMFLEKQPGEGDAKARSITTMAKNFDDFANGWKVFYPASNIVWKSPDGAGFAFARYMIPGERVHPVKLRNQADGVPQWTTRLLESDGRFRVLVLAGDVQDPVQKQRVETLSQAFSRPSASSVPLLDRYAAIPGRFESPIDVFTIHCAPWKEIGFFDFPDSLRPFNTATGYAYEKIWCDDTCIFDRYCDGTAYDKWGVDRTLGALVVIRPDQYIGWVGRLEDVEGMTRYFDDVLVAKTIGNGIEASS